MASLNEEDPSRRPIDTLISTPASSRESRIFCAWAGAWDPHPITPMFLIPSKALGRRGKRSRPPLTMVSVVSASVTSTGSKTLEENLYQELRYDELAL